MKLKTAPKTAIRGNPRITEPSREGVVFNASPGISRILVPIDFSGASERALNYALMLAGRFGAGIILLHVIEPAGFSGLSLPGQIQAEGESRREAQSQRERLLELQRRRVGRRITAETLVRFGRPWSEIPETARAMAADLIVLGAQGQGGNTYSLVGSTAEGVLRHAHCPVLTVT